MYSSMPSKWTTRHEQVELTHISPFWAVMLADRDTSGMVNMNPNIETYQVQHAVAKDFGDVKMNSTVTVRMPFLTNMHDLNAGDLLVLPFDGGHTDICCKSFDKPPAQKA